MAGQGVFIERVAVAAGLRRKLIEAIGQARGWRNVVDDASGQVGLARHEIPDLESRRQAIP